MSCVPTATRQKGECSAESGGRASHPTALLSAALAGFGALLAVVVLVLAALGCTGLTNFGADAANLLRELRTAAHERGGVPAHLGAVFIEPDALGHHGDILFAQAGVAAVFTRLGAADTGFDTALVVLSHRVVSQKRVPVKKASATFPVRATQPCN